MAQSERSLCRESGKALVGGCSTRIDLLQARSTAQLQPRVSRRCFQTEIVVWPESLLVLSSYYHGWIDKLELELR